MSDNLSLPQEVCKNGMVPGSTLNTDYRRCSLHAPSGYKCISALQISFDANKLLRLFLREEKLTSKSFS